MFVEVTCPECRHVVNVPAGKTAKCDNCRTRISAPAANEEPRSAFTPPCDTPPLATPPATPPTQPTTTPLAAPVSPSTELTSPSPAAIVAFVFGLLFFIPFVTQIIAVVAGSYALSTRKTGQRLVLAWIGVVLAALALVGWIAVFRSATTSVRTSFTMSGAPYASPGEPEAWQRTETMTAMVERIQRAATAYHRDFGEWPASLEALAGHGLPQGFRIPEDITYRAVPRTGGNHLDWLLVVSDEVSVDKQGNRLPEPHRLVARLDGGVELLPAKAVLELLDAQPIE